MRRLRFFLLWGVVLGLLIPGVGVLVALIMVLCAGQGKVRNQREEEDGNVSFPSAARSQPRMERIVGALDFVPLVEVFSGADIDLKRGAIEQLVRLRTPGAIHALLGHRGDPSLEVRYYVNSALARIKNDFDEELDAARQQMQFDTYKNSARVFLAKVYLEYAHSGLLDVELAHHYEDEAIFHLTFVLDSQAPTQEAYRALVKCHLEHEQWEQADAIVSRARESGMLSTAEIGRYQVVIYYHTGHYFEIPALMRSMRSGGELPDDWQTAALWWGSNA